MKILIPLKILLDHFLLVLNLQCANEVEGRLLLLLQWMHILLQIMTLLWMFDQIQMMKKKEKTGIKK